MLSEQKFNISTKNATHLSSFLKKAPAYGCISLHFLLIRSIKDLSET